MARNIDKKNTVWLGLRWKDFLPYNHIALSQNVEHVVYSITVFQLDRELPRRPQ